MKINDQNKTFKDIHIKKDNYDVEFISSRDFDDDYKTKYDVDGFYLTLSLLSSECKGCIITVSIYTKHKSDGLLLLNKKLLSSLDEALECVITDSKDYVGKKVNVTIETKSGKTNGKTFYSISNPKKIENSDVNLSGEDYEDIPF